MLAAYRQRCSRRPRPDNARDDAIRSFATVTTITSGLFVFFSTRPGYLDAIHRTLDGPKVRNVDQHRTPSGESDSRNSQSILVCNPQDKQVGNYFDASSEILDGGLLQII